MAFWLWTAAGLILLLLVMVLASRIRIRIRYSRSGELDQLVIIVRALYGIVQIQKILPTIQIRDWSIVYPEKTKSVTPAGGNGTKAKRRIGLDTIRKYARAYRIIVESTKQFKPWIMRTLKKIECTRWRFDIAVGTGDAAQTAVVAGLCWAALGMATGATGQLLTFRTRVNGEVVPNYREAEFSLVWEADFQVRTGTMLASAISLVSRTTQLRRSIKAWKHWVSGPERI